MMYHLWPLVILSTEELGLTLGQGPLSPAARWPSHVECVLLTWAGAGAWGQDMEGCSKLGQGG